MEYTENMHKVGDWVHTEDGVGLITNVFPVYQQHWDEEQELKERSNGLFKDDPEKENKIFGKVPKSGEWIKDLITIKRLCNHDLEPLSRTMCFSTLAYANDKITQKEMREVNKLLKDSKIKKRFDKYECKYEQVRYLWKILIPPAKAVEIKTALDKLENNNTENLTITMNEVEKYFKESFDINIFHEHKENGYNNATIHTLSLPRNDPNYYTTDKQQVFCKILISKQWYSDEDLANIRENKQLNTSNYDYKNWEKSGWNGKEIQY